MYTSDNSGFSLSDGLALSGIGVDELWVRYAALGGRGDVDLVGRLVGLGTNTVAAEDRFDHDLLAQALNEVFLDQGLTGFPVGYARMTPAPLPGEPGDYRARAAAARRSSALAAALAAVLQEQTAALQEASGHHGFAANAAARGRAAQVRAAETGQPAH